MLRNFFYINLVVGNDISGEKLIHLLDLKTYIFVTCNIRYNQIYLCLTSQIEYQNIAIIN